MNKVVKDEGPSGLSIAALVTGILGMGVIPIVLGAVDLVRMNNGLTGRGGKGLDIAGIVLGSLSIIAGIAMTVGLIIMAVNLGTDGFVFGIPTDCFSWK